MNLIIHENKVLRPMETALFHGWETAPDIKLITGKPRFTWKRAKIPFIIWSQIVCFLRWTQEEYGEEAMVTLFYNNTDDQWAAWAFPQEPNGMTIKLLPNESVYATDRAQFGGNWMQAGSVHHHCRAGAFQSGTDKEDETNRDGVHVTLGKMDQPILDVHVRQVFDTIMGDTSLMDWVEMPAWLKDIPACLLMQYFDLALRGIANEPFPEEWKQRIYEKPPAQTYGYQGQQHQLPIVGGTPNPTTPPATTNTNTSGANGTRSGGKRGRRATATAIRVVGGSNVLHAGSSLVLTNQADRMRTDLVEITTNLGITLREAHRLLSTFPDPHWKAEDVTMRQELTTILRARCIPQLYAEQSIENTLGIAPTVY